ncbi:Iron-sulfur cluster-binding protein [Acetobacter malorum]|uniref:Iron-sulfur cluster-binding protein n=2 Tax=Acetobacter malorum TaxID=178901 RepID=A0A177GAN0_9PROT|nr:Iron-sulfur cluster-binding protein [Acetobacter malorum]
MLLHGGMKMPNPEPEAPGVKVFVDTAPVAEKPLAAQAGLGWQGKHTNLVSRSHGSWLFLGEIYTTLALPTSPPSGGGCGSCTRCLTACPTQAFPAPYSMDARRCISYLTIEYAGPIPLELRPAIGTHIYGCDDCLAVCPWNRFAQASRQIKLQPRPDLIAPDLASLSQLDDAAFRQKFSGSPIKRIGRNRFVRNVLIAIGNSGLAELRPHAPASDTGPGQRSGRGRPVGPCPSGRRSRMSAHLRKRSLILSGHDTSVALEPEFWQVLEDMARAHNQPLPVLVAQLDTERRPIQSLASFLRVQALLWLQKQSAAQASDLSV